MNLVKDGLGQPAFVGVRLQIWSNTRVTAKTIACKIRFHSEDMRSGNESVFYGGRISSYMSDNIDLNKQKANLCKKKLVHKYIHSFIGFVRLQDIL